MTFKEASVIIEGEKGTRVNLSHRSIGLVINPNFELRIFFVVVGFCLFVVKKEKFSLEL